MFCKQCGKEIEDDANFCIHCGVTINDRAPSQTTVNNSGNTVQKASYNTMSIIGLIVSIISFFINFWGIVGIAGVILSVIGLIQISQKHENGRALAIIGIIFGGINVFYAFYVLVILTQI